jgi:hypothetical protein
MIHSLSLNAHDISYSDEVQNMMENNKRASALQNASSLVEQAARVEDYHCVSHQPVRMEKEM